MQEKTGQVMGAAQEKGREAKHKAADAADRAMGMGHDAREATRDRAYRAKDAASDAAGRAMVKGYDNMEVTREKAYEARDSASDASGAARDRARGGAQQTGAEAARH